MTADQRFALIISGMGLLFIIVSAVLGLVYRNGQNAGKLTADVSNMVDDVKKLTEALDQHLQWHLRGRRQ